MKNILMLTILFTPVVFASNHPIYEGNYECVGKDKDGEYKISMSIEKTGETYATHTRSLTDDYRGMGVGIYTHSNNALTVGFRNLDDAKEGGVCIFTEKAPNTLEETKAYLGEKRIEKVFCKKVD